MKKKRISQNPSQAKRSSSISCNENQPSKYLIILGCILIFSLIVFRQTIANGFVWDDTGYILGNSLIKNFSAQGLMAIFSDFSSDNYAPVTDIVRALEYKFSGFNPTSFHLASLAFHLTNIILVFWLIHLLCGNWFITGVTTLLFSIHPLQVESVAWASASSNLLSATFLLGGVICYLKYLSGKQKIFIISSMVLFILAVLSKAVVVVFPLLLLLIDYYKGRKINMPVLFEKIPFFLVSLGLGILTLILKSKTGAVQDVPLFSFPQRVVFASYSFLTYLFKLLIPFNLSAFYPYPVESGESAPWHYYIYVIVLIAFIVFLIVKHRNSRKVVFSISFYAITIILVLQLLPVGGAIMADRYAYIPCIGIFYLAADGLYTLWARKQRLLVLVVLGMLMVFFSATSFTRVPVWNNDISLWDDVIKKYDYVPLAYNNRGAALKDQKKYAEALADYSKALELRPDYAEAYNNRGVILLDEGKYAEALNDFDKALTAKPKYAEALSNRGIAFMNLGKYPEAMNDFTKAIELDPTFTEAYVNRGNIYRDAKKIDEALRDYDRAIHINPDFPKAYVNRGTLFMLQNKNAEAYTDLTKAITLQPDLAEAYFDRGILFYNQKKYSESIAEYTKAIELRPTYADAYFNRGVAKYYAGHKQDACIDLQQAAGVGHARAPEVMNQLCR